MLIAFVHLSNDRAISHKCDVHGQFISRFVSTNERMGESLGFGPMLRSRNRCINVLLVFKSI